MSAQAGTETGQSPQGDGNGAAAAGPTGAPAAQPETPQSPGQQAGEGGEGDRGATQTPAIQAQAPEGLSLASDIVERYRQPNGTIVLPDDFWKGEIGGRFSQYATRIRTLEEQAATRSRAEQEAEQKKLEQQGQFKELLEAERAKNAGLQAKMNDVLIRSEFIVKAQAAGAIKPDAVLVIARAHPSFATIRIGGDDSVSGIDEVIKQVMDENPFLQQQPGRGPARTQVGAATNPDTTPRPKEPPKTLEEAEQQLGERIAKL